MASNVTDALISANPTSAIIRTGVVTDWQPDRVQVMVGGANIVAAYLDWYQPPIVGDLVAVVRQDASWLVLGRYAGTGTNLLMNGAFEDGTVSAGIPLGWFSFGTIAGAPPTTATVVTVLDPDSPQGGQVAQIIRGGTPQDVVLTSSPVPVNPGERYFLTCYAANASAAWPVAAATTPTHNVQLMACWFSTDVEAFPSASLAGDYTMVDRVISVRGKPPYVYMKGMVQVPSTVPAGGVMRVGLRVEFGAGTSPINFDYVTVRRSE